VRPKDLDHLGSFRGLNKGEIKASGEAILAALREASQTEVAYPEGRGERQAPPSPEESQVLELLKCYIGILADQHGIAARHLATAAQMLPILRSEARDVKDWVKLGILTTEASRLIGAELIDFLEGRRVFRVDRNRIVVDEWIGEKKGDSA
jgi:ribonuclease D